MATVLPIYDDGDELSPTAGGTLTGGQVVEVTADKTVTATTGVSAKVLGVVSRDTASGAQTRIYRDGIWPIVATGTITAGDAVTSAAAGQVQTLAAAGAATAGDINNSRSIIGICYKGATNGNTALIALRIT